ncbi:MAG: vWA domain-containing protein [Nannocystaceae bacterium]
MGPLALAAGDAHACKSGARASASASPAEASVGAGTLDLEIDRAAPTTEDTPLEIDRRALEVDELALKVDDGFVRLRLWIGEELGDGILDLPVGAAAVGLRLRSGDQWRHGGLVDAAEAGASVGVARATPSGRGAALLRWAGVGAVALEVSGAAERVEVRAVAPLEYRGGRYRVVVPRARGRMTIEADRPVAVDGVDVAPGAALRLGRAAVDRSITVAPPDFDALVARVGRVPIRDTTAVLRVEIDAAPALRPAPEGASVVFVVDASRSVGDDRIALALALVRAYARRLPDAAFEVVVFRRRAEPLFGRFVGAAEVVESLPARLEPGNGSALDAGLRLAGALLHGRTGPRRIVAVTDGQLRSSLTPALGVDAAAAAPASTIVHLVRLVRLVRVGLERDDVDALAPLASSRGGVLYHLGGDPSNDEAIAEAALELIRPGHLDNLQILVDGEDLLQGRGRLAAGEGLRWTVRREGGAADVILRGELWREEIRRTVAASPAFSGAVAAWIAADHGVDLDREERTRVANAAAAVWPAAAYRGGGPPRRPHDDDGLGLKGIGAGGSGCAEGGAWGVSHASPGPSTELATLLAEGIAACEGRFRAPRGGPSSSRSRPRARDRRRGDEDLAIGRARPLHRRRRVVARSAARVGDWITDDRAALRWSSMTRHLGDAAAAPATCRPSPGGGRTTSGRRAGRRGGSGSPSPRRARSSGPPARCPCPRRPG